MAALWLLLAAGGGSAQDLQRPLLTGVNLAGGEFGKPGGRYGYDYIYPSDAELAAFQARGFSVIRLPFQWERLQPQLGAKLDPQELGRLTEVVQLAAKHNLSVVLDPHDYARYSEHVIGSPEVPVVAFAQFWHELASMFRDNRRVIFGLMNEPHDMPTEVWAQAASAAILAIRSTGAKNLILTPGNAYSGAHSWAKSGYGTPNAVAMRGVTDPCNNMAFEFHQYLDGNSSGTSPACPVPSAGIDALRGVTDWLHETKNKGFLGEFGASERPACLAEMNGMLQFMTEHSDVWLGWTYWAAGAWWPQDYMFSAEPRADAERPQLKILEAWKGAGALPPFACTASPRP